MAVAVAGALGWPAPALAADVTSTPAQARQGDPVKWEIVVPEERPGTRTRQIELRLPAQTPVAEAYPMSVDGWAPRITSRTLDEPVVSLHGPPVGTVTAAVTWIRVGGGGGGPHRFAVSMGPLPQAERMTFEVVQTYADGTVVRWADPAGGTHPAPVLTLLPPAPGAAGGGGHGGHGSGLAGPDEYGGSAPYEPTAADGDGGPSADVLLGAGLLAGLGGGAAVGWLGSRWRRRHRPADDAERGPSLADALSEITRGPSGDPDATTPRPPDTAGTDTTGSAAAGDEDGARAETEPTVRTTPTAGTEPTAGAAR
ncbi:hypothetical protein AWW66_13335 [Micromonospora rosaria]|uniref:YncI copper-binding domain-containing protein n=1 Tax=Micromonospora rosaria TaxID=47874 RepID=A0A136PSY3_9ACTN|nr:hypothetical protein AWW66_13335 [Micromonospora rosaria]